MSNLRLTLEYNGAGFSGWQKQPQQRTIQACLEDALGTLFRENIETTASGRTDKGVHARAQVVSFEVPSEFDGNLEKLRNSLNGITPADMSVRGLEIAEEDFNARLNPHLKCYSYNLNISGQDSPLNQASSLSINPNLDFVKMIAAAKLFEGEKDFSSFRCTDCTAKTTIRTIYRSELTRVSDDIFQYRAHGKGFLMHMIRIIVGTLLEVGRGRFEVEDVERIIAAKDRTKAGPTVAAKGLTLEWVRY